MSRFLVKIFGKQNGNATSKKKINIENGRMNCPLPIMQNKLTSKDATHSKRKFMTKIYKESIRIIFRNSSQQ